MTAVKKLQQTRSKRTLAAGRRTKGARKHGKQIRFARPTDTGPGGPTDSTGSK